MASCKQLNKYNNLTYSNSVSIYFIIVGNSLKWNILWLQIQKSNAISHKKCRFSSECTITFTFRYKTYLIYLCFRVITQYTNRWHYSKTSLTCGGKIKHFKIIS